MAKVLIALGVVGVAAVAGWYRPIPPASARIDSHESIWRLPAAAALERSSAALFAETRGVAWVGNGGIAAAGGAWKLLGVSDRGSVRAALVQIGTDPLIKRYGSGDTLPDGSKLISVGKTGIVVERDGCRVPQPLYPAAGDPVPKETGDCAAPGKNQGNTTP